MKTRSWLRVGVLFWALTVLFACETDYACFETPEPEDGDETNDCEAGVTPEPLVLEAERARTLESGGDFVRISFLAPTVTPSGKLGSPWALGAFAGPASYYFPPLPLADYPTYSGLTNRDDQNLLAIRCRPTASSTLDPVLATWPAVFARIHRDFEGTDCPAAEDDPEGRLYCDVHAFEDLAFPAATTSLARILTVAAAWFEDEALAEVLRSNYGIYPEFSGLGYAVKVHGEYDPMTAQVVLQNAIVPEYLVRNVPLWQGGCRCLLTPPYEGRSADPLDWDFVWETGTDQCPVVERLGRASEPIR